LWKMTRSERDAWIAPSAQIRQWMQDYVLGMRLRNREQEKETQTLLGQAELLCKDWSPSDSAD